MAAVARGVRFPNGCLPNAVSSSTGVTCTEIPTLEQRETMIAKKTLDLRLPIRGRLRNPWKQRSLGHHEFRVHHLENHRLPVPRQHPPYAPAVAFGAPPASAAFDAFERP